MMKDLTKSFISQVVHNEFCWKLLDASILKLARQADWEHRNKGYVISDAIQAVCPDLDVKHGPFKGMIYPNPKSRGSSLFPKLIGSYEKELQPVIEEICQKHYTEIIDIGCAEGYYTVGLAMRVPEAKVYAYDTNQEATQLCRKMAELNQVEKNIFIGSFCDFTTLKNIPFRGKALIFSDCEGYEKQLFTKDTMEFFANHDLLIEVHDGIDITISSHLYPLLSETHTIEVVEGVDDIKRAKIYQFEELQQYDLPTKEILLREWRGAMEWWYAKARK